MSINYLSICGRLGRYIQLLRDAREALQAAYDAHKKQIKDYDDCLKYSNTRSDLHREWALDAQKETNHWQKRALAAEAELFNIKINQP